LALLWAVDCRQNSRICLLNLLVKRGEKEESQKRRIAKQVWNRGLVPGNDTLVGIERKKMTVEIREKMRVSWQRKELRLTREHPFGVKAVANKRLTTKRVTMRGRDKKKGVGTTMNNL